jgi:hypothetical protein
MAVSLRTSVTPITTGPAGIYHFTTQIVFELFIVGIGITIQLHYPRLESTAFLSYSGTPNAQIMKSGLLFKKQTARRNPYKTLTGWKICSS